MGTATPFRRAFARPASHERYALTEEGRKQVLVDYMRGRTVIQPNSFHRFPISEEELVRTVETDARYRGYLRGLVRRGLAEVYTAESPVNPE